MNRKNLLLFILLFCTAQIHAQTKLPNIDEVATQFYNSYDTKELSYPAVGFEKRKNGWTVTTKKYVNHELINENSFLYFDAVTNNYYQLPINKKTTNDVVDYTTYVDEYQVRNFQLHQFYGYNGWYKDVINELKSKPSISDSALYSLARAYSTYASSLLSDQGGEAIKSEIFPLPLEANCISKVQLKLYDSISVLGQQAFKRLALQNSEFETIVGTITLKYANEVMVQFHSYLVYADALVPTFQMPDKLYNDSIIVTTKKILEKCPTNAILLSFGDNDFYPVLYVQHKLGIRKDVYLINQSLLGLDRFIYRTTQPQFNSKPIKLSVTKNLYEGFKNDYMPMKLNDSIMPFNKVIALIKANKTDDEGVINLPANQFVINKVTEINKQTGVGKTTKIDLLFNVPFLLKSDWILLDILNNLNGRNFCTPTKFYSSFEVLNKYFKKVDEHLYVY